MSNNRRNNHYHYAEKYAEKRNHSRSGRSVYVPFKAVIASLVVLLMFGLVSTTFGAYMTENEPEYNPEKPGIISEVRNIKASRDVALTGANVDLAESGWSFSGTSYMYFDNTTTAWTDSYIQLVIGKSSYSSTYTMSKITNTNYYVCQLPSSGWGDASYMAVMGNSSSWGSGSWGSSNLSNANHRTGTYTSGLDASNTQRYLFTPASSANGCSISLSYQGTDNSSMDTVTLKAHARHSTNGSSYSSSDSTTGGTVNISSYYFSAYNAVSTSNTGGGDASAEYSAAKTISTKYSTFTATVASGYRFVGWYSAASGGTLVSSNASYSYSTNSGDKEIYARFMKQVTVSTAKNPTGYTGSPTASPSTAVDAGSVVTLSADVKTGVTFGGWTMSSTSYTTSSGSASSTTWNIKPTADLTATAKYTLQAPTISSFSYAQTTEGATAITPTKSATSKAGTNGSLSYSYAYVPGGTGPSDGYTLNSSTGAFSATVAGTYKVNITVTDTAYGLTSTNTSTATITVKPAPLVGYGTDFDFQVNGQNSGAGTLAEPWKVPVKSTSFAITSFIPTAARDANYTYSWTRTDGTYLISNGTITNGTHTATSDSVYLVTDTSTSGTATADVIHNTVLADTQGYIYKVAVTKTRNGVTSDPYYYTFYYGVTADFLVVKSFDFSDFNSTEGEEVQKIYAEDNGIDHINADYDAGGQFFHTMLFFSNNNIIGTDNANDKKVAAWASSPFSISAGNPFAGTHSALPNDASHQVDSLITSISTIARNNVNLMSKNGPKWFRGYIDDYQNPRIGAQYPELHTTVGTSSASADRPIYYIDNTGSANVNVNSRVMAFYVLDGETDVKYQTAQATSVTNKYRFYIPSDAKYIMFAHVNESSYVLPTFSGTTFSMTANSSYLKAWTETVDLTSSTNENKNVYTATSATQASGIYNYTGSMGVLN